MTFDLALIRAFLFAFAILADVVLDGFDLGVGILFPFIRGTRNHDTAMNTVAPVWNGNETWLVLGGGDLFAVFPLAYAVILPALYAPVIAMLLGLVLHGAAFHVAGGRVAIVFVNPEAAFGDRKVKPAGYHLVAAVVPGLMDTRPKRRRQVEAAQQGIVLQHVVDRVHEHGVQPVRRARLISFPAVSCADLRDVDRVFLYRPGSSAAHDGFLFDAGA